MQNKFDPCIKRNITQTFSNNVYIYIYKNCFKKEFNNCINFSYSKEVLKNIGEKIILKIYSSPNKI